MNVHYSEVDLSGPFTAFFLSRTLAGNGLKSVISALQKNHEEIHRHRNVKRRQSTDFISRIVLFLYTNTLAK